MFTLSAEEPMNNRGFTQSSSHDQTVAGCPRSESASFNNHVFFEAVVKYEFVELPLTSMVYCEESGSLVIYGQSSA
jgi:hypothetical protein